MKPLQPVRALAIPTAPRRAAPGRAPNRPTHRRLSAATALLAVLAVSSSCSGRRPNLLEVYPGAAAIEHRPVIIIPGIFGSRLRNSVTGEVVWGRLSNLLTSRFKLALTPARADRSDLLDLPIESPDPTANRDNLEAYDIFDGVAGREFYKRIISTLTQVAGFRYGDINHPQPGEDCFAFYYDWRRDVAENAQLLSKAIERVRAAHQIEGGRLQKVDLIAHSLGGLVARYYVRYGAQDVLGGRPGPPTYAGAADVDTVVLIGVPSEGSLDSLESHNDGVHIVRFLPPEAIFTMPAAYASLPRLRVGPFIDTEGRRLDIDIYRAENWELYGWSVFSKERLEVLRERIASEFGKEWVEAIYQERLSKMRAFLATVLLRAARLNEALDRGGGPPDPVHYFAFGGDCTPTPARAMIIQGTEVPYTTVTRVKNLPRKLDTPEIQRLMSEPGDGSVTRASLLATNGGGIRPDASLFLCETHRNLTENITFQDNLLQYLLYRH